MSADRHLMFAQAAFASGRWSEAAQHLEAAAGLRPGDGDVWNNLAMAQLRMGRSAAAMTSLQRAVGCNPKLGPAHMNLATLLMGAGRAAEAEAHARKAIRFMPKEASAAKVLGDVLNRLDKSAEAERELRRALALDPDRPDVWNSLSSVLKKRGLLGEAIEACRRSLSLKYNDTAARNLVMALTYDPECSLDDLFAAQRNWAAHQNVPQLPPRAERPAGPLRIGLLSADLRSHAVARNILGLVENIDPDVAVLYGYAPIDSPDAVSRRLAERCVEFRLIRGMSDAQAAQQIRADGIDVLISLAGWTADNRPGICAHRPAPVQISMHDLGSSGLECMDYWLTDSVLHPPESTVEKFTETLLRLPCFYLHSPPAGAPEPSDLPAVKNGFATFGSFNNPAKISDKALEFWAGVLNAVPESRLFLHYGSTFADASLRRRVTDGLHRFGVSKSRVTFQQKRLDLAEHLALYSLLDVALDSFPFTGSTTTFEAMYMGVPVVGPAGDRFVSRCTLDFSAMTGLAHLNPESIEPAVRAAADLVSDLPTLAALRAELRDRIRKSPLMDAAAYARNFEQAVLRAWREKTGAISS